MVRTEREDDRLMVIAPRPGSCPECGVEHGRDEPHEWRSVYFRMRFYRKNGRMPTRENAGGPHINRRNVKWDTRQK